VVELATKFIANALQNYELSFLSALALKFKLKIYPELAFRKALNVGLESNFDLHCVLKKKNKISVQGRNSDAGLMNFL